MTVKHHLDGAPLAQYDTLITMRDGVRLAADIYFPPSMAEGAQYPVLLERTPYGKQGTNAGDRSVADPVPRAKPAIAAWFAARGFVYVIQDCRGRYASEGGFTKYVNESADGVDTMAWIMQQRWCNGHIGTLGLSYGAHVQTALAPFSPPGMGAMFIDSGGFSSAFHSGIRQGGAFELKQLTWAYKHALLAPATQRDPARKAALQAHDIRDWVAVNPWRPGSSILAAAPEYEQYIVEQWRSECFTADWRSPALYARGHHAQFADVPTALLCSWFDPYALTAVENYTGLSRIKQGPVRLVLGPWTHGQRSVTYAGGVDFGPAATLDGNLAPDYDTLRHAWFARHLQGDTAAPDYLDCPVKLFVMGGGSGRRTVDGRIDHGGRWRDEADWPPPTARMARWYLHADGALSEAAPQAAEAALAYEADPAHPVPTLGGAIASGAPVMEAGSFDQHRLDGRDDVLVFQSAPLAQAVEVTGQVEVTLWVASSALDTDFTVKLVDVYPPGADYPHGCAINLAHGILRMRFRDSWEHPRPMEPDAVYPITIKAYPTSNLFAAGHRIRIDIASSNFPHFDVNPNTGAPAGTPCDAVVARNRIYVDRSRPSHVLLPVVPQDCPP
ncbi:CocE/NonD family hydrolase [Duganella sp. FT92W]|uniref:CocE/NonD family hydrolase n=1 Tax=Pseudoduganella rivuli TaxID=2666085 RepID=A0A7X2IR54_9BURK|nr:CocE/NonD family hydrolase [Pseudoduganella rivuli]MRV74484.1 CocE/NonD family hydrolase [Pseudoduganella rivuli]